MATIVERSSGDSSAPSAMAMIVAIVAMAVVVLIGLYLFRAYPFNTVDNTSTPGTNINVDAGAGNTVPEGTPQPDGTDTPSA